MKFRTGNIVKHPNLGIVIVTRVTDKDTSWISGNNSNSQGTTPNEDYKYRGSQNVEYDEEEVTRDESIVQPGFNRSKLLGDSLQDYIVSSITKNFDF